MFRTSGRLFALIFGLVIAVSLARSAAADMIQQVPPTVLRCLRSSSPPDTVWIGHVNTSTGLPGTAGGYGPYHIGRGSNHIIGGGKLGSASDLNGVWDFDHWSAGETDSLQGWWPVQSPFASVGSTDFDDVRRPFFCLDYGNLGNYAPLGPTHRTFGVTGYWHADGGSTQPAVPTASDHNPLTPTWAPISGTRSAWCGLRSSGDGAVVDPITGNAYNSQVMDYQGVNGAHPIAPSRLDAGTDFNFPGYGSQWDQMLYRDVVFTTNTAGGGVTVSFKYATSMSTRFDAVHATQAGWFDKDPLKPAVVGDGNFWSEAAGNSVGLDVVDSFMVYVGAPVSENAVTYSDGSVMPVFDPQRRWFSEVVKINSPGVTYKEILSKAGLNGSTAAPTVFSLTIPASTVNGILDADGGAGNGGRLRLVFRVKTNRGYDDETNGASGFSSGTAGAAIIDDVSVSGIGSTGLTDGFESAGDVNNDNAVAASAAWKSTGKPPASWFHLDNLQTAFLLFDDPCGSLDAPVRSCNMYGNVLVSGNHDNADKAGGNFGGNDQDQQMCVASPTINLMSSGSGDFNGMGIDADVASRMIELWGDQLFNLYEARLTGVGFRYAWQSYPATQPNGVRSWGSACRTSFLLFTGNKGCFTTRLATPAVDQLVHTSNSNGRPDSVRVYLEATSRCFSTNLTGLECSPAPGTGSLAGGYFDDLSLAFIAATPPVLGASIFNFWNDAFPTNAQSKPVTSFGLAYDTLAANVRSAYNTAQQLPGTDITGPNARENIPGDTIVVQANGANVRVDLVFRILPGVGNYVQDGNRASGLARRPDTVPRVAATAGDATNGALTAADKFWGAYLADNGAFGTGGSGVSGPGHPGGSWDPNRWNSARCDTAEMNFFPIDGLFPSGATSQLTSGSYMSTYHESDPKYTVLGIAKNRCFLGKTSPPRINMTTIQCGNLGGGVAYPPTFYYPGHPESGFPQTPEIPGGAVGKTYEYTKIIPDGQLTPGAEIQYFFRQSRLGDPIGTFQMMPDTNYIYPQAAEGGYFDMHRWREVRILPDRWKDAAFGGNGMACMLVIDAASRRGDLGTFIALTDSICPLTLPSKRGAGNGWLARPDQTYVGVNVGGDDSICRRPNLGQPGTAFDVYSVVAGESDGPAGRAGSRNANHNTTAGSLTTNKWSTNGPSTDMANNYRVVFLLTSDAGPGLLGPIPNATDDDIGLVQNFMLLSFGAHSFLIDGYRTGEGMSTDHPSFLTTYLKASLRDGSYRKISGNTNNVADLIVQPPVSSVSPQTYGVRSDCSMDNDVFTPNVTAPAAVAGAYYENVGSQGPYVAAVYGPSGGARPFNSLLMGWTMGRFGGMGSQGTLLSVGTRKYLQDLLANLTPIPSCIGSFCGSTGVGDHPGDGPFVQFLGLKSSNPMRAGQARIAFGIPKTDKVQVRIYDVTGRVVRTVADRVFTGAEEHVLIWDGTDDAGHKAPSGVYFYQLKTPSWTSQRKLVVLAE